MIKPGVYRHYKGGTYKIHFIVKHTETLEDLVVYEALYNNPKAKYWVRPIDSFVGEVTKDGQTIPRFQLISE
ncbi:DUF1653 domain-containing protein [Candidatus Woesebacteria bacterium]|nr:DUF1653 domain-containing protein [Candidatus Woesebacteria bacterium]